MGTETENKKSLEKKRMNRDGGKSTVLLFICLVLVAVLSAWVGVAGWNNFKEQHNTVLSMKAAILDMEASINLMEDELSEADEIRIKLTNAELLIAELLRAEQIKKDQANADRSKADQADENQLKADQAKIDLITKLLERDSSVSQSAQIDAKIAFLTEQIMAHQKFIETERDKLIWMLGIIFTIGGTVIGFLGFKTKKDVEAVLDESFRGEIDAQAKKMVDKILAKSVGGNENLQFLKSSVILEKRARSKGVYFVHQKGSENLDMVKEWIEERFQDTDSRDNYAMVTASRKLPDEIKESKVYRYYDIFVYEVSSEELGKEKTHYDDGTDLTYKRFSDLCKEKKKQCIMLCHGDINRSNIDGMCTTTVTYVSKLRETLSALLYI